VKTDHKQLLAGRRAFDAGSYAAAVRELLPLARSGDAEARFLIARMCHEGKGLPENNQNAFRWAKRAAEQGNGDAEALLGMLYAQGQGVSRNDAEAARWFEAAASRGNAMGLMKLGMCHMDGAGVPKNDLMAHMLFDLAASRTTGHDHMCNAYLRDTIATMGMTPAQIAEARRMAQRWKPGHRSLRQRLHLAQELDPASAGVSSPA